MSTSDSCLCSLESTSDFVLVYSPQDDTGTSVHETTAAASKSTVFQNIRQAFVNVANVVLRKGECCAQGGWVDYPQDDDDHSIDAHNIFQCVSYMELASNGLSDLMARPVYNEFMMPHPLSQVILFHHKPYKGSLFCKSRTPVK